MKNKIIFLRDKTNLYVMEELTYNNRRFIFGVECDPDAETVKQNEFIILECKYDNGEIALSDLDNDISITVTNMFLDKIKNTSSE